MAYAFLTGGARSGKSSAAERRAAASRAPVTVIATAEAGDAEMAARIEHHRRSRPTGWMTIEEPIRLTEAVGQVSEDCFVLIDCMTLWLANVLGWSDSAILEHVEELSSLLSTRDGQAVVVSNEVGDGIVPADPMTRRYRDLLGVVNGRLAAGAAESYLVVAGRFLHLEPSPW
ncbi:MAG: bifunctional adenosylcobinamide kinase/adenosylcobinamide-phosphate guanylyltransferase [Acidimicrobiia bacterium]